MGIAPVLVERIYETIVEINRQGTTILLVEQNANYALEVSKRAYVLETGDGGAGGRVGQAARQPRRPEGVPGRMTLIAALGAKALWLLYLWLASAIVASYLSERKGYGSKVGLAFGLLLSAHRRARSGCSCRHARTRAGSSRARSAAAARPWPRRAPSARPAEGGAEMDLTWGLYFPLILAACRLRGRLRGRRRHGRPRQRGRRRAGARRRLPARPGGGRLGGRAAAAGPDRRARRPLGHGGDHARDRRRSSRSCCWCCSASRC